AAPLREQVFDEVAVVLDRRVGQRNDLGVRNRQQAPSALDCRPAGLVGGGGQRRFSRGQILCPAPGPIAYPESAALVKEQVVAGCQSPRGPVEADDRDRGAEYRPALYVRSGTGPALAGL